MSSKAITSYSTGMMVGRFLNCWDMAGGFKDDEFSRFVRRITSAEPLIQRMTFLASGNAGTIKKQLHSLDGNPVSVGICPRVMVLDVTYWLGDKLKLTGKSIDFTLLQKVEDNGEVRLYGSAYSSGNVPRFQPWGLTEAMIDELGLAELVNRLKGYGGIKWGVFKNGRFYLSEEEIYRVVIIDNVPLMAGQDLHDLGRVEALLKDPVPERKLDVRSDEVRAAYQEYEIFSALRSHDMGMDR